MRQIAALAVSLAVGMGLAAAEPFPTRPIELIVPTPPGGGVDLMARLLGELSEPALGQKIVVSNRPGAGGATGVATALRAKPDGYTLAAVWNSPMTLLPHTLEVPYTLDDLAPVTQVTGGTPFVFCARRDFPAGSGETLVSLVRQNPGRYTYGTDGVGGTVQVAAERVFRPLGLKLRPVPFGGAGETAKNFLGGHIDLYGGTIPSILPYVKSGEANCLLVSSAAPSAALPNAATVTALGVPDGASELWRGIIAPKGLPPDRLDILAQAFRAAATGDRFRKFVDDNSEEAVAEGPDAFGRKLRAEFAANAAILAELGLKRK
jgi:tripartite-type tricarboxylate transporter receptor subunit TctC